jgi:hypothetical protein
MLTPPQGDSADMHAIKTTRLGNTKETVMEMSRNTEIS